MRVKVIRFSLKDVLLFFGVQTKFGCRLKLHNTIFKTFKACSNALVYFLSYIIDGKFAKNFSCRGHFFVKGYINWKKVQHKFKIDCLGATILPYSRRKLKAKGRGWFSQTHSQGLEIDELNTKNLKLLSFELINLNSASDDTSPRVSRQGLNLESVWTRI